MVPPPNKSDSHRGSRKNAADDEDGREDGPVNKLWVGNLSPDTTDEDLSDVFGKFGVLDSVCSYASRSFAFIYFKRPEDAKKANDSLQGTSIRGNEIKIEIARPAKPGKQLWVGGLSSSVTKEQLENEFMKFGRIEEFKFLRDRDSALVSYFRLEDALSALKSLNGKRIGGEAIKVDFLRSQPAKRDSWDDFHDARDGNFGFRRGGGPPDMPWMAPDYPDSSGFGHKRHHSQAFGGGRKEGPPSNILWIGYPPSVQIDEHMLHHAMILFGEIERIKCFPARHYSFVEFRSIDEARRAKEGLQGRLFNDPRITILFSSSDAGPGDRENPPFFPGIRGPRPDILYNDGPPFGPMGLFGHPRPFLPGNIPGPLGSNAIPGANMIRPFPPQIDQLLANPEVMHLAGLLQGRVSPPSALGMRPQVGPVPGSWDGEANPFQRESKRSRMGSPLSVDDASFRPRKAGEPVSGTFGQQPQRSLLGPPLNVHSQTQSGILPVRGSSLDQLGHVDHHGVVDDDYVWRGVIAKGGTPVCHARCVPIGKGLETTLPETVNCSARTGLDMLTKHFSEASGFDIVFFLPDSEDDFASYTEFLRYLTGKSRAGVAKFDDGTTLFLVPPSDFLTQVLKVSGPERLYGVVLKFPSQPISAQEQQSHLSQYPSTALPPPPPLPMDPQQHYVDRQQMPSVQVDYARIAGKEDISHMNYPRTLNEDTVGHFSANKPSSGDPHPVQSASADYSSNAAASQLGFALTPELIASLTANILPGGVQSSVSGGTQVPLATAVNSGSFSSNATTEKMVPSHGWQQEQPLPGVEQATHLSQQLGYPYNSNQASLASQYPHLGNVTGGVDLSQIISNAQALNPNLMPAQAILPSGATAGFVTPPQGGYMVTQAGQAYQPEGSNVSQNYGMVTSADASGMFHGQALPQGTSILTSTQLQNANVTQSQPALQLGSGKVNADLSNQIQQLQSAAAGPSHITSESDTEKNLRYQSTLQFAANLLFQIQQQQQQQQQPSGGQALQGSGNQQ